MATDIGKLQGIDDDAMVYPPNSPVRIHPELVGMLNRRTETEQIRKMWHRSKSDLVSLPPISGNDNGSKLERHSAQSRQRIPPMYRSSGFNLDLKCNRREKAEVRLSTPDFNALNRNFVPIPRLFEERPVKREYLKRSIGDWKDQVVKKVPERPDIAISSDWIAPPAVWEEGDFYIQTTKPMFYKNIKYTADKNYTVNPEWISEKSNICEQSPIYRTCALRYGWSC